MPKTEPRSETRESETRAATPLGTPGIPLGSVGGIRILADWSLLIVIALITFGLGTGLFPQWHPDWSPALIWGIAVLSAVLFFASVWLHELAHALTARRFGLRVPSITLFMFGGLTHMRDEPAGPRDEFVIAVVGPVTSLVIGGISVAAGSYLASPAFDATGDLEQAVASLGPVATILLWLGPINLLLGVFNLVPGFPLDGGRILRAILWHWSGSLERATRWASMAGRGVAWFLISCGVLMIFGVSLPIFGSGLVSGLWLVLIGWFLNNAAVMSYRQVRYRNALADVSVQQLMFTDHRSVPPTLSVESLVFDYLTKHEQQAYPVVEDGRLLGLVCPQDVRRVPRERWADLEVREIWTPASELTTVSPETDAAQAAERFAEEGVGQLPVVEQDRLLGLFRRSDLVRWLALNAPSPERAA